MLHSDVAPDNRVLGRNVQEICLKSSIATSKPEFPCPGHHCNLSNSLKLLANTLYLYGASVVLFVCEYYWYHNMWIQPIQPGCHIHALSTPNFRWLWIWGLSDIVISDKDSAKLSECPSLACNTCNWDHRGIGVAKGWDVLEVQG